MAKSNEPSAIGISMDGTRKSEILSGNGTYCTINIVGELNGNNTDYIFISIMARE